MDDGGFRTWRGRSVPDGHDGVVYNCSSVFFACSHKNSRRTGRFGLSDRRRTRLELERSDDVPCLSAVFLFPGRMGTDDGGNAPGCAGTDGNAEGWFGRGGDIWNTGFYFGKKWVVYDDFDGGGGRG